MEYKVVSFVASIGDKKEKLTPSDQLENLIRTTANQGWNYIRVESISTYVAGDNGCFGIGSKQGHTTSRQMVVFSKSS